MRYMVRSVSKCYSWWYSRALIGLTRNPLIQYTLTIDSGNTKLHMFKKSSLLDISIEDLF